MNLSESTIQVLRNFSSINPSIQFREGDVLKTISPTKTIVAKAKLDDHIDSTFAIYNLSRFLGVVSMFDSPTYVLEEKKVTISSAGGSRVQYTFADPSTIVVPPDRELDIGEPDVVFDLAQEKFVEIMKAAGVLSLPDFVIAGEDGQIILRVTDTKNKGSDKYDIVVGSTDKVFNAVFRLENMKILPHDYTVSISSKGISNFKTDDLEYWICIESNSTF